MAAGTLCSALGLVAHDCVAIVGGGGKTTAMYLLAAEVVAAGGTVVVGGTTRFTSAEAGATPHFVVLDEDDDAVSIVREALRHHASITCTSGRGDRGRWLPISMLQAAAIIEARPADLIVFECDGSRNRPFKAPGDDEPAIPVGATVVLTMAGLDVVGRALDDDCVHRAERVASLSGLEPSAAITAECVARVLLDQAGGRKGLPTGARWIPVLNKAEPERLAAGREIARLLREGGAECVLMTTLAAIVPVVEIVAR